MYEHDRLKSNTSKLYRSNIEKERRGVGGSEMEGEREGEREGEGGGGGGRLRKRRRKREEGRVKKRKGGR